MLDRLRVAVRPRSPWEAADLGLALVRALAGPVWRTWAVTVLPPALILAAACRREPWLALLLLWWLKPLLDRPVLHVLAKATFGETPGLGETFRAAPGYCRRGLAATLLWRRLSAERSLLLPVWQLEAPTGAAFRRRRKVLLRRGAAQARLLTTACHLFILVLVLGAVAALSYFRPDSGGRSLLAALFAGQGQRLRWLDLLLPALIALAMAVVEPLYLAAGFGLYLNRRVQLEGWDLELAFRQLGERVRHLSGPAAGVILALFLALAPLRLAAQPASGPPLSPSKAALAEVMKAPEFDTRRSVWRLGLRHPPGPRKVHPLPLWLLRLGDRLGILLKGLIPIGLALLLGYALWRHRRTLARILVRADAAPAPEAIFGLDIRPGRLPADLAGAAARLWDQGDSRGALALLYRGALAHLVHGLGAPVTAGSTEEECRRLADRRLDEAASRYFVHLLQAWQGAAYGGRVPSAQDRDLCPAWAIHFPAPGPGPEGGRS
jgi:hypothetical protein